MTENNSNLVDKLNDVTNTESTTTESKDVSRPRRINRQMLQNIRLIWLDSAIDENNIDFPKIMIQLRCLVNTIDLFTDIDQCVDFLTDMEHENVCLIISDALCQQTIPLIHNAIQLHTVFIYCANETTDQTWTESWFKIKGIFTEISSLCKALEQIARQCEQNAISISSISTSDNVSAKNLDQMDPSFMYTQILKEILLSITFDENHIKQFVEYYCEQFVENDHELNKIKEFECRYYDRTPVWWYTSEGFLYTMLNRALRLMETESIIKMGFFVKDLHHHLEQLHKSQFSDKHSSDCFTVYRGQGMLTAEFEHIMKNKGGLLAFNNFLSTSKDRKAAFLFAESNLDNPYLIGILFVMIIDPSQSTTSFTSILDISRFQEEDEVLFAMQTIFRIGDITPMDGNPRLFQVNLTLTSDNDEDLRQLTDYIRKEAYPNATGWYRLGDILLRMGHSQISEKLYLSLLERTTDENEKAAIYYQLGLAKKDQAEYKEAIIFYEKAVDIARAHSPSSSLNLAYAYNNIGLVYSKMSEYSKALEYYEKSLEIQRQSLPSNHPHLAGTCNNIGMVYDATGEYSKALLYYQKSLPIQQESLPSNHPTLAISHNNIGIVYRSMGDYLEALSSFKKSLEIQQKSLPSNHPAVGSSYDNIAGIYHGMGEYSKALLYSEKALDIRKQLLPSNHPALATSYNNIGNMYKAIGEYSKALVCYEISLEIHQQTLPSNHPLLASFYNNIGMVYDAIGEYPKALSFFEKTFEIQQQSLPLNHPHLADSYHNIGMAYYKMGEYSKAGSYYEKTLEIRKQSFPPNRPDLAATYNNIAGVYYSTGEYEQALSYSEKALEIQKQSFPPNHPDLAGSYDNLALLCSYIGDYSKALLFAERAVNIGQQSLPTNHPTLQKWKNNLEQIKKNV